MAHYISEERWNNDQAGLPNDYSPDEREFDRQGISECCDAPIKDKKCQRCHELANPRVVEGDSNDGF